MYSYSIGQPISGGFFAWCWASSVNCMSQNRLGPCEVSGYRRGEVKVSAQVVPPSTIKQIAMLDLQSGTDIVPKRRC